MEHPRPGFAYVVEVDGPRVVLNFVDAFQGPVTLHPEGASAVGEVGALFGIDDGPRLLVMRVRGLRFAEAREAHTQARGGGRSEPLRQVVASTLGRLSRRDPEGTTFVADSLASPPLGALAVPLSGPEHRTIVGSTEGAGTVVLGDLVRGGGLLQVSAQPLLGQHVAVLGGSGQGKTSLAAALLQQLIGLPNPRMVVFDVNGEYDAAFPSAFKTSEQYQRTALGAATRIPYYALGRQGLARLLLPSERTQRPALSFGLQMLPFVEWNEDRHGAGLVGEAISLFDDCRPAGAEEALDVVRRLREGGMAEADAWPPMAALGCLIAESHVVRIGRYGNAERDVFSYGHIAPLVTRLRRFVDDAQFTAVVDVEGGTPQVTPLDWEEEGRALVERVFGGAETRWKIHVVDLRLVAHDLLPAIMGALLELFAFEIFRRGQGNTHPTLLVLEEAHHYLREARPDDTPGGMLAYERLAKEGRKFGVAVWVSTQRPSEVSPTVLSQCGSWVVFRLTNAGDLHAVERAAEWGELGDLSVLGGLPRQEAFLLGAPVSVPTRFRARNANPRPQSLDPDFGRWLDEPSGPAASDPSSDGEVAPQP